MDSSGTRILNLAQRYTSYSAELVAHNVVTQSIARDSVDMASPLLGEGHVRIYHIPGTDVRS